MSGFLQTEITGAMIADAMVEQPQFAFDVWRTLAEYLAMGAVKDDFCDLMMGLPEQQARVIVNQFDDAVRAARSAIEMASTDPAEDATWALPVEDLEKLCWSLERVLPFLPEGLDPETVAPLHELCRNLETALAEKAR